MRLSSFGPAVSLSNIRRGLLKRLAGLAAGSLLTGPLQALLGSPARAQPLADDTNTPFIGEIIMGCFNYAPRGYALCDGSLLPIRQHSPLFAVLGTTYGGDGRTTFALPDLRGRIPLHAGQGPGLSNYPLGTATGTESVALTTGQLPVHTHYAYYNPLSGTLGSPAAAFLASNASGLPQYATSGGGQMLPTLASGNDQAHENRMPSLAIGFYIALTGLFPAR